MSDGGYYAIKGFVYQFDKSIIEILNNPNKQVAVEQDQDINYEDYIVQVKYYETAYDKSQIKQKLKATTLSLMDEFIKDESKSYCLYAYFNGQNEKVWKPDLTELNDLLGKNKDDYKDDFKTRFLAKYVIVYATDFKSQFKNTIEMIQKYFSKCDEELACLYHAIIVQHLLNLVISNADKKLRVCKFDDLVRIIDRNKTMVFSNAYAEFLGKEKYFRFLRKRYFTALNIQPYDRIFIVEVSSDNKLHEIKDVILTIINKWSKFTSRTTNPYAPYIFLKGCEESVLISLKKELINEGYVFKDGYDYHGAEFNVKTLTTPTDSNNKISIRFINDEKFIPIIIDSISNTKEIYQFYKNQHLGIDVGIKNIKVQVESITDIVNII